MATPLPESASRVQEHLKSLGSSARVIELPAGTRTAVDAAQAIGCLVSQIAKSIVFRAGRSGRHVLVIASGSHRIDEAAIAKLLGEPVHKASADFVRENTGFAIGGVPPVAHHRSPITFVDAQLLSLSTIWAAAGTPTTVFELPPEELLRLTGGQVASVAGGPGVLPGSTRTMDIRVDDLTGPDIARLVGEHLRTMAMHSPPESIHALGLEELRKPEITFWSVWDKRELMGCGALKELGPQHGEIKSMRTSSLHLRKGVATRLMHHILEEARRRSYRRLSLETGSMDAFAPARRLYSRFGFQRCGPFAEYVEDPYSVFMTKEL